MFDPPHLLKCTVSLFRKHNVFLRVTIGAEEHKMEARFLDIVKAYEIDQSSPLVFRALHKLKSSHLAPVMQFSMKVNIAAQVMSHTVAEFTYSTLLSRVMFCESELEQRATATATATFVKQIDDLFDSFNGSKISPPSGKSLKCCVTESSAHLTYWKTAFNTVKGWEFKRITKIGNLRMSKPPSQIGWLTSLNAIRQIWIHLSSQGVSSLRPRYLNQNALENCFAAVRGGCGCADILHQILKTQILNGLTKHGTVGKNCEDDNELLTNLTQFLTVQDPQQCRLVESLRKRSLTETRLPKDTAEDILNAVQQGATANLSVAYVSGFIAKKLSQFLKCSIYREELLSSSDSPHNLFISCKEWSDTEEHLQYPSEELVVSVGLAVTVLERTLDFLGTSPRISKVVTSQILEDVSFTWISCRDHREVVINNIVRAV
ncbi:hypothetical protein NQ315_011647 [Exocentrus adspersus]|uniref:Transposable element P transposase-like GTP-binding insertion domain-containing protein n=1 Tax=Exocentrus adspersus TaxID=1586481 RepID=A0AAV8VAW5_9CUCU|nr:hypothetical protein NQ315_011647 [Exocentrus adspersus]